MLDCTGHVVYHYTLPYTAALSAASYQSEGKGRPAVQVEQSSVALPLLHSREYLPPPSFTQSPFGTPGCVRKMSLAGHFLSSLSQPIFLSNEPNLSLQ